MIVEYEAFLRVNAILKTDIRYSKGNPMLLKTGAILLTISSGFNALLASAILTIMIIFKKNAPFLYIVFDETAISQLNS